MVKPPSGTPEGGGGGGGGEEDNGDKVTTAAMKDLEHTLEQLNKGIDATLSQQGEYGASVSTAGTEHGDSSPTISSKSKEEAHFTLASSPTYRGPLRDKDDN